LFTPLAEKVKRTVFPEVRSLLEKVKNTIEKYQLFPNNSRVVVGFSGGVDSVCLLHLLKQLTRYKLDIWALYVDHGLRPLENEKEIQLLHRLGAQWEIHTRRIAIDIPEKLRRKPQSLQLLAREERYRVFKEFQVEIGADRIALAHHRDDQAETVLYRIIRGTGLDGLAGIPVMREGLFVRPLLEVSRAEILSYAAMHRLEWVEDSSNAKPVYWRNRIRRQLLPELETAYNPQVKNALIRLADLAREQHGLMEELVGEHSRELIRERGRQVGLKLEPWVCLQPYLQFYLLKTVLARVRDGYQLEVLPLQRLRDKIQREQKRLRPFHIYKGITVSLEDGVVWFGKPDIPVRTRTKSFPLQVPGITEFPALKLRAEAEAAAIPGRWAEIGNAELYIDSAKTVLPLAIRFRKPGDSFRPLGLQGRQKLHDFLINAKVPRWRRDQIPLLVDADDRIIWVVGYRPSDEVKVGPETRKAWRISIAML
jgi:tRNA(Ile)-lysidine synthase